MGERLTEMERSHVGFATAYFALSRQRIEDFLCERWTPVFLTHFIQESGLLEDLGEPPALSGTNRQRLDTELLRILAGDSDRKEVVAAVERAFGDHERAGLVLAFADAAVRKIDGQREQLLEPLQALESAALEEIHAAWADLRLMQATVTAHLQSVHDVTVEQDRILRRLEILEERDRALDGVVRINEAVNAALQRADSAEDVVRRLRKALGSPQEKD